ncbi:MBL fold metallo-hydrolase [Virgibacillus sp. C22-A2]|uniref:MBL fold metallo-hydrolase n=1 Tax=Virgibacillus tibetensis TaxID=3042313 RepID=A0ABU6KAT7_9BACI|nr:MBL fold metallo-hydrolase [Virgibacillus sp. C22-A2]
MNVKSMSLGPLGTNCHIVYDDQHAIIVDPGGEAATIIDYIQKEGLTTAAILLTHAHFDHIGAVEDLRYHYNVDVYIHEAEASWLENPHLNRSALFTGESIITKKAEQLLLPGNMTIGEIQFEVIHTPGHSPGSVSFIFNDASFVISGDVLFFQGIGRTDLPGGNGKQLEESIKDKLYKLGDNFIVYPGHGPNTTIGNEKSNNPFFSV